ATIGALAGAVSDGSVASAVGETALAWSLGLAVGIVVAVPAGLLIGPSRIASRSTAVMVEFFKTVPIVAVLPLAILVLGSTLVMKVVLIAFGVVWPLLVQTTYGVRSLDPIVMDVSR